MVNIYLFIELLNAANATATMLKQLALDNCRFANVVALSDEKLVAPVSWCAVLSELPRHLQPTRACPGLNPFWNKVLAHELRLRTSGTITPLVEQMIRKNAGNSAPPNTIPAA
jgi:hypothetical protein